MARLSFLALFTVALAGIAQGNPLEQRSLQQQGPVHTTGGWAYRVCGADSDPIEIKSIEITPDPPLPGEDMTVKVNAYVHERIEEGAIADVTVKLGLIKLLHKQFDVCEEARNADAEVSCPVEVGEYSISQTVALPKEIPRAKFKVEVRGYTVEDDDMICLNLEVDFMKHFFDLAW